MPDLDVDRYCRAYEAGVRAARAELPDYLTDNDSFAEELRARLATQVPEVIREEERPPFDPDAARRDWRHALQDGTALRHGIRVDRPHPLAADLKDMPFDKIARAIGVGLTTSDFSQILSDGYSVVLPSLNDSNPADLFVRNQYVSDYKTVTMGTVEYEPPAQLFEETIPPFHKTAHQAASGALLEYAITLRLSRELLIGDAGRGLVDEMVRQSVLQLQRQDLRLIASVLEANGNLGDGSPFFSTAAQNWQGGIVTPVSANFSWAVEKLLTMLTPLGNLSCAEPRVLMTSANWFVPASIMVADFSARFPLVVACNPYLSESTAYLMADPNKTASLVRLRMAGSRGPKLWPMNYLPDPKTGQRLTYAGCLLSARYLTNIVPVSRIGIVKISQAAAS